MPAAGKLLYPFLAETEPFFREIRCGLWLDLIQGDHSCFHVVIDMAVVHPNAGVIRNHIHGIHSSWPQEEDICPPSVIQDHVSMPVWCMHISEVAKTQ